MANSQQNAPRDDDRVTALIGVSSQTITINGINFVKGVTPVPIAVDPTTGAVVVEPS